MLRVTVLVDPLQLVKISPVIGLYAILGCDSFNCTDQVSVITDPLSVMAPVRTDLDTFCMFAVAPVSGSTSMVRTRLLSANGSGM